MPGLLNSEDQIGRRLKLRDLHVFFAVVQAGSMTKAAAQLRVSPPAVSQIIADLEYAIGVSLLDRSPRGVEPTLYGRALLKGSAAAFDDLKQTIKEIEFLADPTVGEVKIGCPETVAAILPPIIQLLYQHHPGIVVNSPLGPLARVGLARAYVFQGDVTKARAAYQDFLTLWKDADPDIPILEQAKAEYAKLQ